MMTWWIRTFALQKWALELDPTEQKKRSMPVHSSCFSMKVQGQVHSGSSLASQFSRNGEFQVQQETLSHYNEWWRKTPDNQMNTELVHSHTLIHHWGLYVHRHIHTHTIARDSIRSGAIHLNWKATGRFGTCGQDRCNGRWRIWICGEKEW